MNTPRLDVHGVSFRYHPRQPLIHDITFQLSPGETMGVIMPSGNGKTSLMKIFTGILQPTAGMVRMNGIDVHAGSYRDRQSVCIRQGVVFQKGGLVENASTFENIMISLRYHDKVSQDKLSSMGNLTEMFELLPVIRQRPANLSYASRLCAQFARALITEPDILFLDDILIFRLKRTIRQALLDAMERHRHERGMSILAFTSNPDTLPDIFHKDDLLKIQE